MGRQNLAAVVEETVIDRLRCDAKDAFDAAESAKIKFHEKFQTYLGTLAGEQFRQGLDSLLEHGMDPEELIQQGSRMDYRFGLFNHRRNGGRRKRSPLNPRTNIWEVCRGRISALKEKRPDVFGAGASDGNSRNGSDKAIGLCMAYLPFLCQTEGLLHGYGNCKPDYPWVRRK
jgi:hypothetical protein